MRTRTAADTYEISRLQKALAQASNATDSNTPSSSSWPIPLSTLFIHMPLRTKMLPLQVAPFSTPRRPRSSRQSSVGSVTPSRTSYRRQRRSEVERLSDGLVGVDGELLLSPHRVLRSARNQPGNPIASMRVVADLALESEDTALGVDVPGEGGCTEPTEVCLFPFHFYSSSTDPPNNRQMRTVPRAPIIKTCIAIRMAKQWSG